MSGCRCVHKLMHSNNWFASKLLCVCVDVFVCVCVSVCVCVCVCVCVFVYYVQWYNKMHYCNYRICYSLSSFTMENN